MEYFPAALEKLVEQFARLPGIGSKSAQRLAFFVLSLPEDEAKAFAERLKERTGLPLTLWDERRTTVDAHRILGAQGVRAKNRKDKIDSVAATLILEGFLDWKRLQAQRQKEEQA